MCFHPLETRSGRKNQRLSSNNRRISSRSSSRGRRGTAASKDTTLQKSDEENVNRKKQQVPAMTDSPDTSGSTQPQDTLSTEGRAIPFSPDNPTQRSVNDNEDSSQGYSQDQYEPQSASDDVESDSSSNAPSFAIHKPHKTIHKPHTAKRGKSSVDVGPRETTGEQADVAGARLRSFFVGIAILVAAVVLYDFLTDSNAPEHASKLQRFQEKLSMLRSQFVSQDPRLWKVVK